MSERLNTVDLILQIQKLERLAKDKSEESNRLRLERDGIMMCVESLKKEFEMEIRHFNERDD